MLRSRKKEAATFLKMANTIIILIIILVTATATTGEKTVFQKVLFSFHMPAFFIICGITLYKRVGENRETWLNFIKRMALSYLTPYVLWALIYSDFSYRNIIWVLYGSWEALNRAKTLTILWFLPCMFVAIIIVELALEVLSKSKIVSRIGGIIPGAICIAIGLLLPNIGDLSYPWGFDVAFVAAGFMLFGYSMKDTIERLAIQPILLIVILVISTAIIVSGIRFRGDNAEMMLMRSGDYGNIFWFIVNALAGSTMVLSLAALCSRSWKRNEKVIKECDEIGINRITMGMFVIHMPLLQQVVLPLLILIPIFIPKAILFLIAMFTTKIISGWIIRVLAIYIPQLFGIFPKIDVDTNEMKQ